MSGDDLDMEALSAAGLRAAFVAAAKDLRKRHGVQSCIIIATYYDEAAEISRSVSGKSGNYYANYGALRQWVIDQDAQTDQTARDMQAEP